MAETHALKETYLHYFKETFDKLKLIKYEETGYPVSGLRSSSFKNEFLRLRLLFDRGVIETQLAPLFGTEDFRSIEYYASLIELSRLPTEARTPRKRELLHRRMDFEAQADFLLSTAGILRVLLDEANYKKTLGKV